MKIGIFANPNSKGQIVIPKKIRDELNITRDTTLHITISGQNISMVPVKDFIPQSDSDNSYSQILKKTQGAWAKYADAIELEQKAQAKIEIKAAKKLKTETW